MADEVTKFLLDMFGVPVREFIPGHTTFVAVDHMTDQAAFKVAKKDKGAARFISARLRGELGAGAPRPGLYRRSMALRAAQRAGKQGHPNNPHVRAQAEALKKEFGINLTRYEDKIAACDYIAEAEAIRWPEEVQRDFWNLGLRLEKEGKSRPPEDELLVQIRALRANRINRLISDN